jgi:GNAT superfamily N-acetyltransferase
MRIFKNLIYDIKAIRKYGLITHFKYIFDIKHVIINLHFHLDYVLQFKQINDFVIKEVNISDENILNEWCFIVNDAFRFENPYNTKSAFRYLTNHLYKDISNLFFVYHFEKPVATFFIGTFKSNSNIGCAGRFAVLKEFQGHGLGVYIVTAAMDKLRTKGLKCYEGTFNFKRDYSIRLFIKCGGTPIFQKKYMQLQPTRKNFLVTWLARRKVKKLYEDFRRKLMEPYLLQNGKL